MYSDQDTHRWVGFPIRISMDQRLLAAPHGFSQRATSFIASWCQGIHRTPFSCSHHADRDALVVTIPILHRNHPTGVTTRGPIPSHMLPPSPGCENIRTRQTDAPSSTSLLSHAPVQTYCGDPISRSRPVRHAVNSRRCAKP